jgi:large conductance mechanosensitive channel
LTVLINFLIIAWIVFMLVKVANRVRKQAPPAAPSAPSTTEKLLTDIRDALVTKK